MYRIINGPTENLPDVAAFIETLKTLDKDPTREPRYLFDSKADLFVTRAPGRLDVMGGIADYSGSLVLQLPIAEATFVALQRDPDRMLRIVSLAEDSSRALVFEMSLADFEYDDAPVNYEFAREYFQRDAEHRWAAYVAGAFLVLMRERRVKFHEGARILIASQVPEGKGVSSSAALEVAVMRAVAAAFEIHLEPRDLALLCQKVENVVVGAPCGVMDQMTAVCGEKDRLLALLCQPAELCGMISIPAEIAFWGVDSGVRHSVSGADYGSVRVGTFMGYRIIAEVAGLKVEKTAHDGVVHIDDPRWGNYLSNVTPSEFEQLYACHLPEQIEGAEFIERYQGTTDSVTRIIPEHTYPVRTPTAHAIYEHHRVRLFAGLIEQETSERSLDLLGELMYQSHASYSACGLGSEGTDRLVQLAREAGPAQGLYGAKITGGGSGGTVAVLGRRSAGEAVARLAATYAQDGGYQPYIFSGSSAGSESFEYLRLSN